MKEIKGLETLYFLEDMIYEFLIELPVGIGSLYIVCGAYILYRLFMLLLPLAVIVIRGLLERIRHFSIWMLGIIAVVVFNCFLVDEDERETVH